MKKKLFALSTFLFLVVFCGAQSAPSHVISPQGGYAKSNDYSLEWTVGETIANTSFTPGYICTQGFNQSYISVKKISNAGNGLMTVFVAPNPVTANLTVDLETLSAGRYALMITNFAGVSVYQRQAILNGEKVSINMHGFANGAYLLRVYDANNKTVNTTKIIKL